MGSGVSVELEREFSLTGVPMEPRENLTILPPQNLEEARKEISRLRQKLHDQAETFGSVSNSISNTVHDIQERGTEQWATCHEITASKSEPENITTTLFGNSEPMPSDVVQSSELGDCYLVAAMSVIAEKPELVRRLFPNVNEKTGTINVNQSVTVLINHQKQWREVILDTSFPIEQQIKKNNEESDGTLSTLTQPVVLKPLYGKSKRAGTYWVNYLEKAYAKIYGSYAALQGGDIAEALSDLTGFPVVTLKVNEMSNNQQNNQKGWQILLNYHETGQLMACGHICSSDEEKERTLNSSKLLNGVRPNHAYSILDVKTIGNKNQNVSATDIVIRLRNPWGHLVDDNSSENSNPYSKLPKNTRGKLLSLLGIASSENTEDDGTFWLLWSQFAKSINNVYVCLNSNNNTTIPSIRVESVGRWTLKTAGGCSTYPTFRQNPMYLLNVPTSSDGMVTITITQPDVRLRRRQQRNNISASLISEVVKKNQEEEVVEDEEESIFTKLSYVQIGLEVIRIVRKDGNENIVNYHHPHHVVLGSYETITKTSYWNKRDVTLGPFKVVAGTQLIVIPSTYYPLQLSTFLLSCFYEPLQSASKHSSCYLQLETINKPIEENLNGTSEIVTKEPTLQSLQSPLPLQSLQRWYSVRVSGEWSTQNNTSGGHGSSSNKHFCKNPQWSIVLPKHVLQAKLIIFLKNETKTKTNQPLTKSRRIGMGICLYRGVPCIRTAENYNCLDSGNIIGNVVYSNALEIARSETIIVGNKNNNDGSDDSKGKDTNETNIESTETNQSKILMVAACYKAGDEAPFSIQIISNVSGIIIKDAPLQDSRPTKKKKKDHRKGQGKGKGKGRGKGGGGSMFGAAKQSMSSMSNMYENL